MITTNARLMLCVCVMLNLTSNLIPGATAAERRKPADLPSVKELPDPFTFNDGTRLKARDEWSKRRAELLELTLTYQYGHLPPASPLSVSEQVWQPSEKASDREQTNEKERGPLPDGATETQLVVKTGPDGKVAIPLVLTRPPGKGPFPTIIRGDLCWGRVTSQIRAEVIRRGYMLAEFDRTAIVPDEVGPRAGALYDLYPDQDFAALAAWAWGFHRVADYLLTRDDVQKEHLAVTGHSRGGKAALLAGATDERIAITAPNNSGCGGAGCYRFSAPKSETIGVITKRFPYWFQAQFPEFIDNLDRLPIDQHSVKALCAPRALLATEALGDLWANPEGSQQTYIAAKQVYDFLGASDKIGIAFREGGHQHNLADWGVLLDFADVQWFGRKPVRRFDELAFPNSPKSFSWSAPAH